MPQDIFNFLNTQKDDDGWLSFEHFLNIVQHHPLWGYYGRGQVKLGKGGDFYTAPTLSPLFGETIADFIAPVLSNSGGDILELGAGQGDLAEQIISQWGTSFSHRCYYILETSAALIARQKARLSHFSQIIWLESLPTKFVGVIIANEVLDSVPFRLYRLNKKKWFERGVKIEGNQLQWLDKPPRDTAHHRLLNKHFPDHYQTELSLQAEALLRSLAIILKQGMILIGDYGTDHAEYYHPQRTMGTMRCYYQQKLDDDPLSNIGNKDITAHIDFTAMANAGIDAGCQLLAYLPQTQFLVQAGILQRLSVVSKTDNRVNYLKQLAPVQKILSPAEMGNTIKWMIFCKKIDKKLLDNFFMFPHDNRHHL